MRSGSRRHRGEAGGGGFKFPPLLATNGRIHKGDCDMRTGAIFARGSCRALAWVAALAAAAVIGHGEAAAQQFVGLESVRIEAASGGTVGEGVSTNLVVRLNKCCRASESARYDQLVIMIIMTSAAL